MAVWQRLRACFVPERGLSFSALRETVEHSMGWLEALKAQRQAQVEQSRALFAVRFIPATHPATHPCCFTPCLRPMP